MTTEGLPSVRARFPLRVAAEGGTGGFGSPNWIEGLQKNLRQFLGLNALERWGNTMGKIVERQRERQVRPAGNWKESPLVIATASSVATAAFMASVVLPLTTSVLRTRLEALEPAAQRIAVLEGAFRVAEEKRKAAERAAERAYAKHPFSAGTPYPAGLDKVVIGSSEREVLSAFPGGELDNDQGFVTVNLEHPNIQGAGYHLKGKPGDRRVDLIMFTLREQQLSTAAVKDYFNLMFGPPAGEASKGRMWWKATPRENVEFLTDFVYFVRPQGDIPSWAKTGALK